MVEVAVVVYPLASLQEALLPVRLLLGDQVEVLHQMRWQGQEEELLGKDTREQVV
jgi:hypothetical protein